MKEADVLSCIAKSLVNLYYFQRKVSFDDVVIDKMGPFIFAIFFTGLVCNAAMAEQCNGPRQLPIHGKMLRGHIYEELFARSGDAECLFICRKEDLCQSFNFVKTKSICEFNNRTKEAASPENFIDDKERYYVKLDVSRGIVVNSSYMALSLISSHILSTHCQMIPKPRGGGGGGGG